MLISFSATRSRVVGDVTIIDDDEEEEEEADVELALFCEPACLLRELRVAGAVSSCDLACSAGGAAGGAAAELF